MAITMGSKLQFVFNEGEESWTDDSPVWMIAQTDINTLCIINMETGKRFRDPSRVQEDHVVRLLLQGVTWEYFEQNILKEMGGQPDYGRFESL